MTTDAARKAVFNTPELLETIISFVSPTGILTKVQRLSRQWKEVVDSSPIIKNQLWMRVPNVNAVQPVYFTNMDKEFMPVYTFWDTIGIPVYSHAVTVNPAVLKGVKESLRIYMNQDLQDESLEKPNGDLMHSRIVDFTYDELSGRPSRSALENHDSWRSMYLTSPPVTTALLLICNYDDVEEESGPKVIKVSTREHDGLTLGLVHDSVMAALPMSVREKLKTTEFQFIGSLCIALQTCRSTR
jgi:hypothetical protein